MPSIPINRAVRRDSTADSKSCWIEVPNLDGNMSIHLASGEACEQYELVNHDFCSLDPGYKHLFQHSCPPPLLGGAPTPDNNLSGPAQPNPEEYGTPALIIAAGLFLMTAFAAALYRSSKTIRYIYDFDYDFD